MSKWLLTAAIIGLGGVLSATDVEARRLGGGRNMGAQRNVTAPPAQTPAKRRQAAPAQQQPRDRPRLPRRAAMGRLLGGLALGGMLGYLFGGSGLMGFLLLALLAIAAVVVVRALMQRRAGAPQPVQFAGMRETVNVTPASGGGQMPIAKSNVPAGFDASSFLRAAKLNFLRLQAANDAGRAGGDPRVHHRRAVRGAEERSGRREARPKSPRSKPSCSSSRPRATSIGRACASQARCARRRAPRPSRSRKSGTS